MRRYVAQEILCRSLMERGWVEVVKADYAMKLRKKDNGWLISLISPGMKIEGFLNHKTIRSDFLMAAIRGLEDITLELADFILRVGGTLHIGGGIEIRVDIMESIPSCSIKLEIHGKISEYQSPATGLKRIRIRNLLREIMLGRISQYFLLKILTNYGFSEVRFLPNKY